MQQSLRDRLFGTTIGLATPARQAAQDARGLEIGGPSGKFRHGGLVPLYGDVASLDNVNFAGATLWEKDLLEGGDFAPAGRRLGTQYLREASDLFGIPDAAYDLVMSSHTIEHLADPLRALKEWRRVCREDGYLVLVLPHRDGAFDRRRPITALDHLRADERAAVAEDDDTHFSEVLHLHDLRRDPFAGSRREFESRVAENAVTRGVHHHVFDCQLARDLVAAAGWVVLGVEARRPHDIVVLAVNTGGGASDARHSISIVSPFKTDRSRSR